MIEVPEGYALVGIDALKAWGKYEEVRDACQVSMAPQAIEAQGVRNLLARYENQWHRIGELWERCQGKVWPKAESEEFARLRDELTPATRALLLASALPAPQAKPVAWIYTSKLAGNEEFMTRCVYDLSTYKADRVTPLYTNPAKQPKPLTNEQREAVFAAANGILEHGAPMSWEHAIVDAVEAAHGITKGPQQ